MDPLILVVVGVLLLVAVGLVVGLRSRARTGSVVREIAEARGAQVDLGSRLSKSRQAIGGALRTVFGRAQLDQEFWDSLEEALISADVGVEASSRIVARVRDASPTSVDDAKAALKQEVHQALSGREREVTIGDPPSVLLVVGVNGTGKTTSIAKLAHRLTESGLTPILGAADTFRAAADTQLRTWAGRVGVDVVAGQEGADPASVAFDALAAARARGCDVVIVDTAGRLHSKKNLMSELGKIRRVLERDAGPIPEVLLVLDATAGQNGVAQARQFTETAGVTGIVLTKLDGTARGGIVVAIEEELDIPVKMIGVGEGMEDLIPFDSDEFVDALLADL
jgi:fused signal recognition particle receptor